MRQHTASQMALLQEELLSGYDIHDWSLKLFTTEIYDHIGQLLSLAKIQMASVDPGKKKEARSLMKSSDQLLTTAISDLRRLTKMLTPKGIHEKGFARVLAEEAEKLERTSLYKMPVSVKGTDWRPDPTKELILFSILQYFIMEALFSGSRREVSLSIRFKIRSAAIRISYLSEKEDIPDPGKTISEAMMKRARLIGASIRFRRKDLSNLILIGIKKTANDPDCTGG